MSTSAEQPIDPSEQDVLDAAAAALTSTALVVGEALVDIVERGGSHSEHPGGGPANIALGLSRFGLESSILTCLARDARGGAVRAHLEEAGVRILEESWTARRTPTATAHLADDGGASYEFDLEWAPDIPEDVDTDLLHVGSIGAFLAPGAALVRSLAAGSMAREVSFDPNIRPSLMGEHDEAVDTAEYLMGDCTIVKLSDEDAAWLWPGLTPDEAAERILSFGPNLAVVTRGGEGALLRSGPSARVEVAAPRSTVVDTIGAGDTFMAALLSQVLPLGSENLDDSLLSEVGSFAAAAAALVVRRAGADIPTLDEVAALLAAERG